MNFDPNIKYKPKAPRWATYVPDRRTGGKFKIHAGLGYAKNAFQGARDAILYEWMPDEDQWVERARIEGMKQSNVPCPSGCGNMTYNSGWDDMVFKLKPCYRCNAETTTLNNALRELGV